MLSSLYCYPVLFSEEKKNDKILLYWVVLVFDLSSLFMYIGTLLLPGELTPKVESQFSPSRVKYANIYLNIYGYAKIQRGFLPATYFA